MTKRAHKAQDGLYYIKGHAYSLLKGSRAQVWNKTAYKTMGGLTRDKLHYNTKTGRIVSKSKHKTAKKDKRLAKLGYKPVRGAPFKPMQKHTQKTRKSRRRN